MRVVRDTWLMDDPGFDEPADWAVSPEFVPLLDDEAPQSFGIRSLREDDAEDCWHDDGSRR